MTGYTVNTGTSIKFSEGWDRIFAGGASSDEPKQKANKAAAKSVKAAGKAPAKAQATAKKKAGKVTPGKKVRSKQAAQRARTSGNS
ncbi:MAG: hypothetical protein M3552_04445 [Planctomycetota bacterium]|nr:hypothetical protein [Planctomycetaceae bacterium]MDQ3329890.1 hypothetical protein [Planctomycetota bacterium]